MWTKEKYVLTLIVQEQGITINGLAAGFEPVDNSITTGKNTVFLQLDCMYKPLE
jgi:hypothetical protein